MQYPDIRVLDGDGNDLPPMSKDGAHANPAVYCLCAHLWIYDSNGQVLLQKRALHNRLFPGRWDISAAGHVDAGEQPLEAMRRELAEELGVHAAASDFHFAGRRKGNALTPDGWIHNEFVDVYSYRLDVPLSKLHMQEEEVAALQWMPIDQFEREVHDPAAYQAYVPHGIEYYEFVLAELRQQESGKRKG